MRQRRTLLLFAFVILFCSAARPAGAQWCSEVIGMSACDPSYPGVWAGCVADSYYRDCLADASRSLADCQEAYGAIWSNEYASASRDCGKIEQECQLMGGWINAYGGCSWYLAGGGGGDTFAGWGGGGGDGISCKSDYLELQVDIGGVWVTIWEGWGTVCDAMT
jgi:hypothetical protein